MCVSFEVFQVRFTGVGSSTLNAGSDIPWAGIQG